MSSEFKYDSYGNSIDGTDYCSGVETFAQNLIEDNEKKKDSGQLSLKVVAVDVERRSLMNFINDKSK